MHKNQSSIIPSEQVGAVTQWDFGDVEHLSQRFAAKLQAQALEQAQLERENLRHQSYTQGQETGYSQGYSEGYNKGYEEGFQTAHTQATEDGQRALQDFVQNQGEEAARNFLNLFANAQTQVLAAEQSLAQGVLELSCEIARQVLRRELQIPAQAIEPVLREALGMLTADHKSALVRLNPQDVATFTPVLQQEFSTLALTLAPDPHVTSGGCVVESAGSVIDGTLERRWQRVVTSLGLPSPWQEQGDEPV